MASYLDADAIADLVYSTTKDMSKKTKHRWTDLTSDIQEYHYLPKILKNEKVLYAGSRGPQFQIMKDDSGAASYAGLYHVDSVEQTDVMTNGSLDWRHARTYWIYDELEEAINSGDENVIFDLIKVRRAASFISLAKKLEETWWSAPPSATDTITPRGYGYYVVKWPAGATTPTNPGNTFLGTNPICQDSAEITAGAANVSSTTYPRWANWAAQYVNITPEDAVRRMREAAMYTMFKSPITMPNYKRGDDRYGIYTTAAVRLGLEDLALKQNDSARNDLGYTDGLVTFHRREINWVPQLDSDTGAPIIGLNWAHIWPYFQRGWYLKESKPARSNSLGHTVKECWVDLTVNTACDNRRAHWILSTKSSTGTTS